MNLLTVHGQDGEMRTEEPVEAFLVTAAGRAWPREARWFHGCHILTLGMREPSRACFLVCKMGKPFLLCQ